MDAYPNPFTASLLEAKSFFERQSSGSLVVLDVTRKNVAKPLWLVTYRLQNRFKGHRTDFELLSFTIDNIYEVETLNGFNLIVEYGLRTSTTTPTCCGLRIKKRNGNPLRKHDIPLSQCTILVKRKQEKLELPLDEVLADDLPLKVMYNGSNHTKRFVKKNRLTKKTFTELLQRSRVPSKYINLFVRQDATTNQDKETDKSESSTIITRPPSYSQVSYNYDGIDDLYIKSKLHKPEVLSAVIDYLTIKQFRSTPVKKTTPFGARRKLYCVSTLKYNGLPTDESLLRVFNDFCKDNEIPSDEASCFIQIDDKGLLA